MSRIAPVSLDDLPQPLREARERGKASRMLISTIPVQVWGHRPDAALAWLSTLDQLHNHPLLDSRLRKLFRLRIASITTCTACQLARKTDNVSEDDIACLTSDSDRFNASERAALRYAELFSGDYMAINDAVFTELALWFSVPEIVDLNMFCALMLAGGRMTYVQCAYETTTIEGES
ncbi:carboxymuconolactone decarboxylase family protein [Glaciimonas sp. Gout2]|uniref:carboxymuconolactone decarboxylase family protein n=1 Tax=unclassified Glaciimonas TaxID=2644401 RepID=UPI002B23B8D9|nr:MULTISPECIES: carboxymuconolactone decarboxylase family protein [unclassified Glaciimonas]MEB0013682.1 carboxymuconolactone decarboxylase family protein [Glaciimonas sp. Cout2]MEB0081894.1 carboxymuconolactone decarboxylase family protein [Glaciimonas sp. Gout2]